MRRAMPLIGGEADADHAQRLTRRIAGDHTAAFLNPGPQIVTVAQPVLDVEYGGVAREVFFERRLVSRQILGVHTLRPAGLVALALEVGEARQGAPVVDPGQPIVRNLPVPQTDLRAPKSKLGQARRMQTQCGSPWVDRPAVRADRASGARRVARAVSMADRSVSAAARIASGAPPRA